MRYYISAPPMNPISRLLMAFLAVLALVGVFFFGLVVLIIFGALFTLFTLGLGLRSWWLGRKPVDATVAKIRTAPDGEVIDAEYTVVSRRRN